MSKLIPTTGRKSLKVRLIFLLMYALLGIGGITMVVPFLAMMSNSFKSVVDSQTYEIPPRYWYDQQWLNVKYVEQETNYDMDLYRGLSRSSTAQMKDALQLLPAAANKAEVDDYYTFLKALPVNFVVLTNRGLATGNPGANGTHPAVLDYRKTMLAKYQHSLDEIGKQHGQSLPAIDALAPPAENWHKRSYQPEVDKRMADFLDFKRGQKLERLIPVPAEASWNLMLRNKYGKDVEKVKAELGVTYAQIEDATFPLRKPAGPEAYAAMWEECMRKDVPIWFVRADASAKPAWEAFLTERYARNVENYNLAHAGANFRSFADIPLPKETPLEDTVGMSEWADFIGKAVPASAVYLDTPEQRYRDLLKEKYGTIAAVNAAYGTDYANWAAVYLPTIKVKVAECQANPWPIKREFMFRNYRTVASYLVLHGRAFLNTAIYIIMALFFTLTVNPITAYALSRFKLRSTNKILLFMLATMAFPAEIAMIPNFLILKELHLLNTYWALVLPGMASGFNIFLLKGMFDGLPQDLYEAAALDGASEMMIFWKITMPLVKPFLAYLSLGTFVAAYSAFAFAFLLCPDQKMWTIMVFLQQMTWASQPVKFASYVLASIPTLIVFVTCQRIIMRGIVLPTEK